LYRRVKGTVEAIGGLQGQVDRETGFLTPTATYRVVIEGDEHTAFEFNMTMNTGESGEMTDIGSYRETNDTFAEVTSSATSSGSTTGPVTASPTRH
jgi:hypothetical protein